LRSIKQAAAKPIEVLGLAIFSSKAAPSEKPVLCRSAAHVYSRERPAQLIEGSPAEQALRLAAIIREFKGEAT